MPIVIALGLGISVIGFTAMNVISQNSTTLTTQKNTQLALEAARAGLAAAIKCIDAGTYDWGASGNPKLQPQTDCHGATVTGKPTMVLDDGTNQTSYTVDQVTSPYGDSHILISSTGKATLKDPLGRSITLVTKTVRSIGQLNGGVVPVVVTAGWWHSCVISPSDGKPYCWGYNADGELGNGSTAQSKVPVAVTTTGVLAGKTVTDISAGNKHTCVVASGKAYCWGYNGQGQLGNGGTGSSTVPVAVTGLGGLTVTKVVAGVNRSCAVASGWVYCWGYQYLGTGQSYGSPTPMSAYGSTGMGGKTVTTVSSNGTSTGTGKGLTCAVASGRGYCWGTDTNGEMGDGTTSTGVSPMPLVSSGALSGKTVTDIAAGDVFGCAVASARAYCWGANDYGQMGSGSGLGQRQPIAVDTSGVLNGKTVTDISAGDTHACAVASGKVYCWGYNGDNDLGNGTTTNSAYPVAVSTAGVLNGKTVTAVDSDNGHSCVGANGGVYCWGYNANGQLGNGTTTNASVPVAVTGFSGSVSGSYSFDSVMTF